ncbi:MAG TPA: hypothetical protein VM099_11295 [Gemmatimonadaceae bacterium]|nr:hypothetical protein [Gemmatimonadaceae bacterium]
MKSDLVRAVRVGSVLTVVALLGAASFRKTPDSNLRKEVVRLRAHFDSVDSELRARNVSNLTAVQRQHRAALVKWLKEYRDAGVFPINDKFAGRLVPFFRDSHGVLCAMAYLIDRSGRGDIVDKVARARNNAFIHELSDDPTLIEWLNENGLSVDEAARIQPSYDGIGFPGAENRVSSDFAITTMLLGGGAMAFTGINIVRPTLTGEAAGALVGIAAILNGLSHIDENRGTKRVAYAGIYAGSAAVATSIVTFLRDRAKHHSTSSTPRTVSVAPALISNQHSYRLGISGAARF